MRTRKTVTALIFGMGLLAGCAELGAATGLAETPDTNTEGMTCADMAERAQQLSSTQRRVEAGARLTGSDVHPIRVQYNEARAQIRDAMIAAGCG